MTHPRCPICGSEPIERTDNVPRDDETVWRFACDGMYMWAGGCEVRTSSSTSARS